MATTTIHVCSAQIMGTESVAYTVFDVITELFAYVIMGPKKRRNYRTPLDLK